MTVLKIYMYGELSIELMYIIQNCLRAHSRRGNPKSHISRGSQIETSVILLDLKRNIFSYKNIPKAIPIFLITKYLKQPLLDLDFAFYWETFS